MVFIRNTHYGIVIHEFYLFYNQLNIKHSVCSLKGFSTSTMSRNAAPSQAQIEKLVEFMEARTWLATGHARTAHARNRTRDAWLEIETALNSDGSGCVKNWQQWCKYWKDKKGSVKRKASALATARRQTGGGVEDVPELNNIELRILNVMGGESFAVGDRHLELNPFHELEIHLQNTEGNSTPESESLLQDQQQAGESVGALNIVPAPSPGPSQLPLIEEELTSLQGSRVCNTPQPVCNTQAHQEQNIQSTVHQQQSPVRRRILQPSPVLSNRRRRTLQTSPGVSSGRRLFHRSPPSQRRTNMASLTDRFIAIEERRAEADIINARAHEIMASALNQISLAWSEHARAHDGIANALNQLALAWSEHARALNALAESVTRANNR